MTAAEEAAALTAHLPHGYGEGAYDGRRWGATLMVSPDARRAWLYAEALGGGDHVSFNLYRTAVGPLLRPCEMPEEDVLAFLRDYRPDAAG